MFMLYRTKYKLFRISIEIYPTLQVHGDGVVKLANGVMLPSIEQLCNLVAPPMGQMLLQMDISPQPWTLAHVATLLETIVTHTGF